MKERRFTHYLLFVTYFPHLIAGPVLHHGQMMPQFADASTYRLKRPWLARGLAIFALGLAKKLLLADPLGQGADAVFSTAQAGGELSFGSAWIGTIAYALQIYFDFSGYSDMAIGLSLCFNIRLPINFDAPYKSLNIIDFWRRWHISLSTFLRDYLYIPLGGGRHGAARRHLNLFITMLLGGLWHGASWTFVLWGGLHGVYLTVNHAWRAWRGPASRPGPATRLAGWLLTFVCVCVAWVLFQADSLNTALSLYKSMSGLRGLIGKPLSEMHVGFHKAVFYKTLLAGLVICLAGSTTQSLMRQVPRLRWPVLATSRLGTAASALTIVAVFAWSVSRFAAHSPFLYSQF